jgi:hypothetical protein
MNALADNERMRSRPSFVILGASQHWRVKTVDGARVYYRSCLVQYPDGRRAARYVRDDLVAAA